MEVRVAEEGIGPSQEAAQDIDDFQIKICKVE